VDVIQLLYFKKQCNLDKKQKINSYCHITKNTVFINGKIIVQENEELTFSEFSKKIYKDNNLSYSKFFKMDNISKLAFLGAELIFRHTNILKQDDAIAIVLSNRASSLDTDRKYQESISDESNYYPSPAVFVYTLPNIAIGEISIRHQLKSENAFFVFDKFNAEFLNKYATVLIKNKKATTVLCGWVDFDNNAYEAFLYLVSQNGDVILTTEEINRRYQNKN